MCVTGVEIVEVCLCSVYVVEYIGLLLYLPHIHKFLLGILYVYSMLYDPDRIETDSCIHGILP
jgi:hypothetical protein